MKTPRRIYLLLALAGAALALNIALSLHFYSLRGGTAAFKSFCNIDSIFNCDSVAMSRFAELVPSVPLSDLGAAWGLSLLVVAIYATQRFWRREALRVAAGLTLLGAGVSVAYFLVMALALKTYCLLCLLQDGVVILAALTVLSLKPEGFKIHKPEKPKWKTLLTAVGLSGVGSMILLRLILNPTSIPAEQLETYTRAVLESPVVALDTGAQYPQFGSATAPITVVEFSDFQCPFCRNGALTLNTLQNRYPDKIRVVFRNFPLDASCNSKVQARAHPFACEAAKAAWCAVPQGHFKAFYEEAFDKQRSLAPGVVLEIAKSVGLQLDSLQGCMGEPGTLLAIQRDTDEGDRLGVKSTPTFFINGHKMEGAYPLEVWVKVVDTLLANAR